MDIVCVGIVSVTSSFRLLTNSTQVCPVIWPGSLSVPAANEPPGRVNPSGMLVTGELAYDVASGEASPWTALNDGVSIPGLPVNESKSKNQSFRYGLGRCAWKH